MNIDATLRRLSIEATSIERIPIIIINSQFSIIN